MIHIKAPGDVPLETNGKFIFLAGSIEQDKAEKWQDRVAKEFEDNTEVVILNPRRDDWSDTWEQRASNQEFLTQVKWELHNMAHSDWVFMYFDPSTKSPVSLLELGLLLAGNPFKGVVVVCPDGFWRKGNVEITCKEFGQRLFHTFESGLAYLKEVITAKNE